MIVRKGTPSTPKVCSECGKEFIPGGQHLFRKPKKNGEAWQCSYSCYRRAGGDTGKYNRDYKRTSEDS